MRIMIDGTAYEAEYGEYILSAAARNGIDIPTLCHNDALQGLGTCRLCIVELIEGERTRTVASCIYPITRELEIRTDSSRIYRIRKSIMKLLLSRSPENEQLKSIASAYGLMPSKLPEANGREDSCILCGLCVKACEAVGANAIATVNRGTSKKVSTAYDEESAACIGCGACAAVCPTGAIAVEEQEGCRTIWKRSFELAKCKRCGKYYEPLEYVEFIRKKLGAAGEAEYCSSCKKVVAGHNFKDIYGI